MGRLILTGCQLLPSSFPRLQVVGHLLLALHITQVLLFLGHLCRSMLSLFPIQSFLLLHPFLVVYCLCIFLSLLDGFALCSFFVLGSDILDSLPGLETRLEGCTTGLPIGRPSFHASSSGSTMSLIHNEHELLFLCCDSLVGRQLSLGSLSGLWSRMIFLVSWVSQSVKDFECVFNFVDWIQE